MMYKALKSFSGVVSMSKGEKKEIFDKKIADDLLKSGYIELVTEKFKNKAKIKNKYK